MTLHIIYDSANNVYEVKEDSKKELVFKTDEALMSYVGLVLDFWRPTCNHIHYDIHAKKDINASDGPGNSLWGFANDFCPASHNTKLNIHLDENTISIEETIKEFLGLLKSFIPLLKDGYAKHR